MRIKTPLILGAGPAGSAAAIHLSQAGLRPLLIDRSETAGDALCGGFLSWKTAAQLSRLGLDCASLGAHSVNRLRLLSGQRSASAPLPSPAWGLSRRALDTALRRRAVESGAQIEVATIREIDGLTARASDREWAAETLFLASGKHDVRAMPRPRTAADPALGVRLRVSPSPELARELTGTIELHLFEGGYAGIVLQEDGSANICLALKKSLLSDAQGSPQELLALLSQTHPRFAARLEDGWREARIDTIGNVPYGWIARDTRPGLFRLGDQAAVIPSLAGEGMSIALASAHSAAQHWLSGGAESARAFQRDFAQQAAPPVRMARLARKFAETSSFHGPMLAFLNQFPALAGFLMDRTRIRIAR